jgi:prevent-host-death family protein
LADDVSIAEARDNLARLVKRAERGEAIKLTRRGRPVAVLLSADTYRELSGVRPGFSERYEAFRRSHDLESLAIDTEIFDRARDRGAGRDVPL